MARTSPGRKSKLIDSNRNSAIEYGDNDMPRHLLKFIGHIQFDDAGFPSPYTYGSRALPDSHLAGQTGAPMLRPDTHTVRQPSAPNWRRRNGPEFCEFDHGSDNGFDYFGAKSKAVAVERRTSSACPGEDFWAFGNLEHASKTDAFIPDILLRVLVALTKLRQAFEVRGRERTTVVGHEKCPVL